MRCTAPNRCGSFGRSYQRVPLNSRRWITHPAVGAGADKLKDLKPAPDVGFGPWEGGGWVVGGVEKTTMVK